MANSKDVLVITASSKEGLEIQKYLKPVSAHIVAGSNIFSDFLGELTEVFGGSSNTYQKKLTSLYKEVIEKVKLAAYEMGGNCILELNIEMDEIPSKGTPMFMLTAIGTAVIIHKNFTDELFIEKTYEKLENDSEDRIDILKTSKVNFDNLTLNDYTLNFITINKLDEVFPFILNRLSHAFEIYNFNSGNVKKIYKLLVGYIDAMPIQKKLALMYNALKEEKNEQIQFKISDNIMVLNLAKDNNIKHYIEIKNPNKANTLNNNEVVIDFNEWLTIQNWANEKGIKIGTVSARLNRTKAGKASHDVYIENWFIPQLGMTLLKR